MADFEVAKACHATLTADAVDTVEVVGYHGKSWSQVEVVNRSGSAEIFVTNDGSAPSVEGDDCDVIPAALGASILLDAGDRAAGEFVKLISSGTPDYSVIGRGELL